MSTGRVVVVGSLNEDLTLRVDQIPRPGETVLASSLDIGCGGKGANQAVAAARAGAQVRMVGCVGPDAAGRRLLDRLRAERIDVSAVVVADQPTGLALIAVTEEGENSIIVASGANHAIGPATLEVGLTDLATADVVVAQGEIPAGAIAAAATLALAAGARFVLNLAPPIAIDLDALSLSALIVNEHEAASLVSATAPEHMAERLAARYATTVAITLGAAGIVLCDGARSVRQPAYRPARVVDTTGAGDTCVGAFAAALARGLPIGEAVRWGAAAGSIAVTALGAQGARATAAAIESVISAAS